VTGDGEVRSPLRSLLKFLGRADAQVFERTPFGGSRLPLATIGRRVERPSPA